MSHIHRNAALLYHVFKFYAYRDWKRLCKIIHVCRTWRTIILSYPEFWIHVPLFCVRKNQLHPIAEGFVAFLPPGVPIELEITACRPFERHEITGLARMASRIKRLTLRPNTFPLPHIMIADLSFPFQILEKFEVFVEALSESFGLQKLPRDPQPFCLPGITTSGNLNWMKWRLDRITSLIFKFTGVESRPSHADLRQILISNKDTLTRFEYTGYSPLTDGADHELEFTPHPFPALQFLTLSFYDDMSCFVRDTFSASNSLRKLYLCNLCYSPESNSRHIKRLDRSNEMSVMNIESLVWTFSSFATSLQSLSLLGIKDTPGRVAIRALYASVPRLEYFTLYNVHQDFFSVFYDPLFTMFPRLKQLMVTDATGLSAYIQRRTSAHRTEMDKLFYVVDDQSRVDVHDLLWHIKKVFWILAPQDEVFVSKVPVYSVERPRAA